MNWLRKLLGKPVATTVTPAIAPTAKAARQTEDVEALRRALANTADAAERSQLSGRIGQALADAAEAPRPEDAMEIWIAAVNQVADKSLALAWVAQIRDETVLSEMAIRARGAEVRYTAAQRIEASALLEHVAQAARNKDKRVYQHCSEHLRQRRQAEASARRAREISDGLHRLLAAAPVPGTALLDLKKELATLVDAGETGVACNALMQQALDRLHQESEALRDLQTARKAADALLTEIHAAAWPWAEQIEAWRDRLAALRQVCAELPAWLAEQAAARGLSVAVGEIESRLSMLDADDARNRACEDFLAALESAPPADTPAIAETLDAWAALAKPDHADANAALQSRWRALDLAMPPVAPSVAEAEVAIAPTPMPRAKAHFDQEAVRALLDQLEQAISEGHLVPADAVAKQIKAALGGNRLNGAIESRLHSLQAQLETLRGWARWGTQQAREKLAEAARELLVGERDVEELAAAITALRDEWKRLNAHAPANKAEWESFDAILEQAYQPVAVHRAEQAARQAEARVAREALCAAWETELAAIDWAQADFKAVEAQRAEWIKLWRAAPRASFRDERALNKRFDTLVGAIDQHLDAARAEEYERRAQLIAAAQALAEQPDLRLAMAEAKALQQRWSQQASPVRLKRGDDQKQWNRFRAACNAVFERLDAQRAEQAAEREAQAQSRQQLLDAFAASLDAADGADAGAIKQALARFRTDWEAARPKTRDADDKLENQARDLQRQAQQRLDALRQDKHRARFELLARKAALVERVETAALSGWSLEAVLAEAKQAWEAQPTLPGKIENQLVKRLATASRISQEELAAGRAARADILLDLEIALGLPSPESEAEVRRERQLGRLQDRFGAAPQSAFEAEDELVRWYATSALPDAALDQRVAAVIDKLAEQAAAG